MLEHQHRQLIAGIQELYRRLAEKEPRPDLPISASCNGQPLTHRILEALNIIRPYEWNSNEKSDASSLSSPPPDKACGSPLPQVQSTFSSDSSQAQRLPVSYELTPPPTSTPPPLKELTRKPTFALQMPPPYFVYPDNQSTGHSIHGATDIDWLLDTSILYGEPSVFDPELRGF